jgi:quercetin dioxygenase-like cupin family protein
MPLPAFITALPGLNLPFPEDVVTTHVVRSDSALAVFFVVHKDLVLPPHSHKGQWGTVIEGAITLTINGHSHTFAPGQSYDIPNGTEHSAHVMAGTIVFDVFEEPDRYPLRGC